MPVLRMPWRYRIGALMMVIAATGGGCGRTRADTFSIGRRAPVQVVAANADTCVRLRNGEVWCWGLSYGAAPAPVGIDGRAVDLAVSPVRMGAAEPGSEACVVIEEGSAVRCVDDSGVAREPGIEDATDLCAGPRYGCAAVADGTVWCWGANELGQLGDGTTAAREVAAPVLGIADAVEVACGEVTACARLGDGSLWCWGSADNGSLGVEGSTEMCGGFACATAPRVLPVAGVQEVSLGLGGGWARIGEAIVGWGANGVGEVGDGTMEIRPTPVAVPAPDGVVSIHAGYQRRCAITAEAELWCVGAPPSAGPVEPVLELTELEALRGASAVTGGWSHQCAIVGREVRCWGNDMLGQLGDGEVDSTGTSEDAVVVSLEPQDG